jgi:hypothetical protein
MSVSYEYDPGRLELFRPRADGLLGRSICGSAVLHLVIGCLLVVVKLPQPPPPKRRPYKITEVRLLPRVRPAAPPVEAEIRKPEPVVQALSPKDLSVFLNDLPPAEPRRSRRRSRRSRVRPRVTRTASLPQLPKPTREVKPEAPETAAGDRDPLGPKLVAALPHLLERTMAERQPQDPVSPPDPQPAKPAPAAGSKSERPDPKPRRTEIPAPKPRRPEPVQPKPVTESPTRRDGGGDRHEPAPRPVRVARAERPRPLSERLPAPREEGGSSGPSPIPSVPVAKPALAPVERPTDVPTGRPGKGKRIAELPGNLFGDGSGQGASPSRREPSLPEGRPGAADRPGPARPRVSRGAAGHTDTVHGGDNSGISSLPAPGGVRLSDDRPGTVERGAPTGFGERTGKGTREASLPSTGPDVSGRGSGASFSSDGAGGGYGAEGPRAVGGGSRPGRPSRPSAVKTGSLGDGSGGSDPGLGAGIGLGGLGPGAGGSDTQPRSAGGRGKGAGGDPGDGAGKRVARADLPLDGSGDGGRGTGRGTGAGSGEGHGTESGPKTFGTDGKRKVTTGKGTGSGDDRGSGTGKGNGDEGGVALPGGGGGDDGPGRDGRGDGDSSFKGARRKPAGVYVDTTGSFTLPGAIYQGDYNFNSRALRKIMDELNSRTKVKVRLGGNYESISPGSFRKAPVIVFSGHKTFELTEEQRKVLKEYVDKGGMIWADLSKSAFDKSFADEMEKVFGRGPVALPSNHRIFSSFYILSGPPPGDFGDSAPFQGITIDGRLAVVITPNRYLSAAAKSLNARDEDQEGAIQAVVNVYMYAVGNYKAVQDASD